MRAPLCLPERRRGISSSEHRQRRESPIAWNPEQRHEVQEHPATIATVPARVGLRSAHHHGYDLHRTVDIREPPTDVPDLIEQCLGLTDADARAQWRRIAARAWQPRQERYLSVELLLCFGLFRLFNPHAFGGANLHRLPAEVHALARALKRPADRSPTRCSTSKGSEPTAPASRPSCSCTSAATPTASPPSTCWRSRPPASRDSPRPTSPTSSAGSISLRSHCSSGRTRSAHASWTWPSTPPPTTSARWSRPTASTSWRPRASSSSASGSGSTASPARYSPSTGIAARSAGWTPAACAATDSSSPRMSSRGLPPRTASASILATASPPAPSTTARSTPGCSPSSATWRSAAPRPSNASCTPTTLRAGRRLQRRVPRRSRRHAVVWPRYHRRASTRARRRQRPRAHLPRLSPPRDLSWLISPDDGR